MHVKSVDKKHNPSFQAVLKYNKTLILETLKADKKLVKKDFNVISNLLEKVDSFAKMEEDSVIKIIPRADNGQVNLYCGVYDSTECFFEPVQNRSVRKLVQDSDFRTKYLNSIKNLVKNVYTTRKEIDKIAEVVANSKNIKGFDPKKNLEGIHFTVAFIKSLEKGNNSSARIIKLLKSIDKNADGKEINIEIKTIRSEKSSYFSPYFVVTAKSGEEVQTKRVPLSELFKKSLEDVFVFKQKINA